MSKLLLEEYPLVILPALAQAVGLHEAIILQQMHYWLLRSKEQHDGRSWVYNSYTKWQVQFPFLSQQQIGRAIRRLEQEGYIVSANYNKVGMDRTKWYSIEYERVGISEAERPLFNSEPSSFDIEQPSSASERPIPETTPETPSESPIYPSPEWLDTLRGIKGWEQRGEPHLDSLLKWVKRKGHTDDVLEGSAIGLSGATTKALRGYEDLASAFQKRINLGYDTPGGSNGKVGQDIGRYAAAGEERRRREQEVHSG